MRDITDTRPWADPLWFIAVLAVLSINAALMVVVWRSGYDAAVEEVVRPHGGLIQGPEASSSTSYD